MDYTSFEQLPPVLSVDLLARVLGIGKNSAYDLVRSGRIPSVRIGRQIRVSKSAVKSLFEAA